MPGGPDISDDSDSGNDMRCHKLRSTLGKTHTWPKNQKPRRRDLPDEQRKWYDARDRCVEEAEAAAFRRDKDEMRLFSTPLADINYANTIDNADILASSVTK